MTPIRNTLFCAAMIWGVTVLTATAETKDIDIPKATIATAFNGALSSMVINIDSYGNRHGSSWHHDNSYLLMPDGKKSKINVPEMSVSLKSKLTKKVVRRWKAYINDFFTTQISVSPSGSALRLTAAFESAGEEIKVKCLNRRNKECKINVERDGEINNAVLRVDFKPVLHNQSITFAKDPKVTFTADFQLNNALCKIGGDLCNKITRYKPQMKSSIEALLKSSLNGYRGKVAALVKSKLAPYLQPKWTIKSIQSSGNNYRVRVQYPDPIGPTTVSMLNFSVVQKKKIMACPGPVSFKATIKSKYKVSGKVWLEHENGSRTKKRNWQLGKNQSASSTLVRKWKKRPGKKNGWSRMVITFSDHDGKKYTKKTSKATFSRTCSKSATDNIQMN